MNGVISVILLMLQAWLLGLDSFMLAPSASEARLDRDRPGAID
jgi:hypothetical protein